VQSRGGKGRQKFGLFKFRSMYVHLPDGSIKQAERGDCRVTPVGRILRKTSADELPQLLNVLRGEMSIVGPRPHAVEHDDHYAKLIKRYPERARCKPGITGLAQVCGLRGATPTPDVMADRIDADLRYIETASFAGDIVIVLRTAWSILACRDAAY
jgi:lipopolysaccharide/colanic/teichoic acid biosynthesis glycosyltransferase